MIKISVTYNFIVDRLVVKWDKVPTSCWNEFIENLQQMDAMGFLDGADLPKPWVGKGFNAYKYNQNVGKGDGGMLFSWHANAEAIKRYQDEFYQSARLEFNPAKAENWQLRVMAAWTENTDGYEWRVDTVDLAVDLPLERHDIFVLPLNGAGMRYYEGTRYFGSPGKDGQLKVYDKAAERGIPGPLTRIEYTWRGKCSDPREFDGLEAFRRRYYVLTYKGCDPVVRGLIYAINDGEISYDELPKRMKTKIKEALLSQQPLEIHFNQSHLIETLNKYYIR